MNSSSGSRYDPSVHSFHEFTVTSFGKPSGVFASHHSFARRSATSNFAGVAPTTVGWTDFGGYLGFVSHPTEACAKYALSPSVFFAASNLFAPFSAQTV